ncbi:hypothetical protein BGZ60DRAFT_431755 [Tricladium varicosporioides]|nr:hypothetical protein BGZ60DRAFT_431755 [Hymenoscyphus varicosporioides]
MGLSMYYTENHCILSGPRLSTTPTILPTLAIDSLPLHKPTLPGFPASRYQYSPHRQIDSKASCISSFEEEEFDSLIQHLAKVPKEVRERVYKHVVWSWAPGEGYPRSIANGFSLSLARRFKVQQFGSGLGKGDKSVIAVPSSREENTVKGPNFENERVRAWEMNEGMLDFFKGDEWVRVRGFVRKLERFEGREHVFLRGQVLIREKKSKKEARSIGLLEEFVVWFWGKVVVDLRAESFRGWSYGGKPIFEEIKPCPSSHHKHHTMIRNISLHFAPPMKYGFKHCPKAIEQFRNLCNNISCSCPNLQTTILYLKLDYTQLRDMYKDPKSYKGWARALWRLKFQEDGEFVVMLLVVGFKGVRRDVVRDITKRGSVFLGALLRPICVLWEWDGHYGLKGLFGDD